MGQDRHSPLCHWGSHQFATGQALSLYCVQCLSGLLLSCLLHNLVRDKKEMAHAEEWDINRRVCQVMYGDSTAAKGLVTCTANGTVEYSFIHLKHFYVTLVSTYGP